MGTIRKGLERCCGIDIDLMSLWPCILMITAKGVVKPKHRQFANDDDGIKKLITWLKRNKVVEVAFESTGVFWSRLANKLADAGRKVTVGHPNDLKAKRGYKTDRGDGRWIADLLRLGAIPASFIPPQSVGDLRLLTRQYVNFVQDITKAKNRIRKVLRQAGITLDRHVKKMIDKVSVRKMIPALIAGADAMKVAKLGRRLKASEEDLLIAVAAAPLRPIYRLALDREWRQLRFLEKERDLLWSDHIEKAAKPFSKWIDLLLTIPGFGRIVAICVIGEIGVDMSVFPSIKQIASWAGLCPGNNASGGKRKRSRAVKGNKYLRRILTEAAWGAIHAKGSVYSDWYYSNLGRLRYKNKAAFAIAHKLLRTAYSILKTERRYQLVCSDEIHERQQRAQKDLRRFNTTDLVRGVVIQLKQHQSDNSSDLEDILPDSLRLELLEYLEPNLAVSSV